MIRRQTLLKSLVLCAVVSFMAAVSFAQDDVQTFRNFQFSFNRVSQAWMKTNDTLAKAFKDKGKAYPPSDI